MKFLVLALALVAVASALPANKPASDELHQIQQIINAIYSPNTDPATAVALEAMLQQLLLGGISAGPAIVQPEVPVIVLPTPALPSLPMPQPIVVLPDIIEGNEPIIGGPAIVDIVHGPAPVDSAVSPLVQIIVNVNARSEATPSPVAPVVPAPVPAPIDMDNIIDLMPVVDPVNIVDVMPVVDPINIVDVMPVVDPINIVDVMPVVNPIIDLMPVVNPIQTMPAVTLPGILN